METSLFICESQEQVDDYIFVYYKCTLKADIRNWKKGTHIPIIAINIYSGDIQFASNKHTPMDNFKVCLTVKS